MTAARRVAALDWEAIGRALAVDGFATTPPVLDAAGARALAALFPRDRQFRTTVDMARHRFGEGRYRYFAHPLPRAVAALRAAFYARLAPIANAWRTALGEPPDFPARLDAFLARCAAAGQRRPTPLLLAYGAGGWNALHQDRYGAVAFPLQVTIQLSRPGVDFDGGEFLLVEQRPRQQSVGHAVALRQGEAVIFANDWRPVAGTRGHYRGTVRHGVSRVRRGARCTLGLIFHDAA